VRAAVLHEHGAAPRHGEFPDPREAPGRVVVDVAAAALHHLDLLKASGTFYMGPPPLPSVVGTDGVGRLADGRRVFFDVSVPPYGSMAERTLVPEEVLFDVEADVADAHAAACGNTGLGAWLALDWRADLQPGETVLVLGATGAVGSVAVQAAKLLGAGRVVAATRGGRLPRAADASVDLDAGGELAEAIREAAGGEVDVTIDTLWGAPALAAIRAAARHARHIQVGQLAGLEIPVAAPALRSVSLDLRGFSVAHPPVEVRRQGYATLIRHVGRGEIVIELEEVPLERIAEAWARQQEAGGAPKLVLIP
jgi:NADPH:quinone reductase-like Zn-dependent oxidoreductase